MAEKMEKQETNVENEWISFEEESEVSFLPQPPSRVSNMSSERYIGRLEQKLRRIKDPSNITSKNIVSTLTEAREFQMSNMVSKSFDPVNTSSNEISNNMNRNEELRESNCCCVSCYSYLFPKQAKTTQEIECLLDEDELAISSSEQVDDHHENYQPGPG